MKNEIIITELNNLMLSEWWKYITSELDKELSRLTDEILADWWIDPRGNDKNFTFYDLLRSERLGLKDFINKPQVLIDALKPAETIEMDS